MATVLQSFQSIFNDNKCMLIQISLKFVEIHHKRALFQTHWIDKATDTNPYLLIGAVGGQQCPKPYNSVP